MSASDSSLHLGFLQEWDDLEEATKKLFGEALELVEHEDDDAAAAAARLREIFTGSTTMDINMQLAPVYGETLLMQAVHNVNVPIVQALLDLGADPDQENYMDMETPLAHLEKMKSSETKRNDDQDEEELTAKQTEILELLRAKIVPEQCAKCGKTDCKLMLCGNCRRVKYCSSVCQKNHWKATHKKECKTPDEEPDMGQQVWDAFKERFWLIGQDPAEVEELQEQLRNEPDNFFVSLFLQDLGRKLKAAEEYHPADSFAFLIRRNKSKHAARKAFEELDTEKQALIREAFELLKITDDDELNCESSARLVTRIQEIASTPGLDVNTRSVDGEYLIHQVVSNYRINDDDPNAQLGLVRFLLEKGADPSLQDSIEETPLSILDQYYDGEDEGTEQHQEIIRLLLDAGDTMPIRDD